MALIASWVALAIYPQPLFAYSAQRANVVMHARSPLPPQATTILDDVARLVARSPLYNPTRTHHVFLCDTPAVFAVFALWDRNVGGLAQVHLGGNVFIRPSSVVRGTVIGPSGIEKTGERTLTYFVAHEVAHAITADHVGRWRYLKLAAFQQEGYADFVAFDHAVDLASGRAALVRDDPQMSPKRSGLYARYELLVAYLLQRRGLTVEQLLAAPMDVHQIERQLLAESAL